MFDTKVLHITENQLFICSTEELVEVQLLRGAAQTRMVQLT